MDNKTFFIIFVLFLVLWALWFLYCMKNVYTKENREADRVYNTNWSRTVYCYKLPASKEETLELLRMPSVNDELMYGFDSDNMVVTFTRYYVSRSYRLVFLNHEGQWYLKLVKMGSVLNNGRIYFGINLFCIKKLGATPVPYFETIPNP